MISMHSPLGDLTLAEEDGKIISLDWGRAPQEWLSPTPLLNEAKAQLDEYFDGKRLQFDLPLAPAGTDFQHRVWKEMQAIPAGSTKSYGEIAKILKSSARAVGNACGINPITIIIPCHRIMGAGGRIGGYSGDGGVETKLYLLRLENVEI